MHRPALAFLSVLALAGASSSQVTVFATDFDGTLPTAITPGTALLTGVQGYAGLGATGNQFAASFLRSATGNVVRLDLANLPAHNAISLAFLFAAIDSLDGTGSYPSGDFFKVTLDGVPIFRESFANALPSQIQSYVPPAGVQLARRVHLGFTVGSYYGDSAYDLGADPVFAHIPHSASTARFEFVIEGQGIQSLDDESWAMDRLRVDVDTLGTGTVTAYGTSCGPVLSAASAPRIGQTFSLTLDNEPPGTVASNLAIGFSDQTLGAFTLPLPLDFLGFTGCVLLNDLAFDGALSMVRVPSPARLNLPLPGDPSLVGLVFFAQGWSIAPGVNPGNAVFSGGLRVVIGS